MIRVNRGDEPDTIRLVRRRCLAAAIIAKQDGKAVKFDGYDVAKEELVKRLNSKCAYCEDHLQKEGNPVEHFRPKGEVRDENGQVVDRNRYWWLAWTWENLLFACDRCNSHTKMNQFPLEPGTNPLVERSFDLNEEKPLLIDPAKDDPRDHIFFKWSDSRGKWIATPNSRSVRGLRTITILQLEEDDRAADHVKDRVRPIIEQIRADVPHVLRVQETWKRLVGSLFAPKQPFHAITWDVLNAEFSQTFREKYQVALPQLGAPLHVPSRAPCDFDTRDDPAEFQGLPDRLQHEIRAMGERIEENVAVALLRKILVLRKWTEEELARLLRREPSTIQKWNRAAQRQGALR